MMKDSSTNSATMGSGGSYFVTPPPNETSHHPYANHPDFEQCLVNSNPISVSQTTPMVAGPALASSMIAKARDLKSDKIVDAWDQIGVLTIEITKSIMKQQVDQVAKRYRTSGISHCEVIRQEQGEFRKKRSRVEIDSSISETESMCTTPVQTFDSSTTSRQQENWSGSLSRQVDRMARMSKLIMEIEYCHRLLRTEMVETQKDLCSEYY